MKVGRILLGMGGLVCLVCWNVSAQSPQSAPSQLAGNNPEQRQTGQSHVEMVMKRLEQRNPVEFERLNKLRQENPEAFRKALKERLEKLHNAPPNERTAPSLAPGGERGPSAQHARNPGGNAGHDDLARRNAELNKCEQEIRSLADGYKAAAPETQKSLQLELKQKLNEAFDLREKARQEAIQKAETQLAKLKKDTSSSKGNREAVVERRFKELTEDKTPGH